MAKVLTIGDKVTPTFARTLIHAGTVVAFRDGKVVILWADGRTDARDPKAVRAF